MRRIVPRLAITLLCLWSACLALLDAYGLQDQARAADAIVVLGSRVYPGGQAGPALARRAHRAAGLYAAGLAPVVICSGGRGPGEPVTTTEAKAACDLAASLGVPRSALLLEDRSHSTEENALYTAVLMSAHGWHSVVVVSDGYHLYRAGQLFRRAGLVAYPSPAQTTAGPMSLPERYIRETRELAALGWYWMKTAVGLRLTAFR